MELKPIDQADLQGAAALLAKGFPERPDVFWTTALRRLADYHRTGELGPIGQLLLVKGHAVGVILTIASRRNCGVRERKVINLSSWYVEPDYRSLAPMMLRRVVADASFIYTDISPSPPTREINRRLGFEVVSQSVLLFCLPWLAISHGATTRILRFEDLSANALPKSDHQILAHHHDLGCLAAAIEVDGRLLPLLFHKTYRTGLPVARLLLAENRQVIADNIATIARFLLRNRVLLLTMHADPDEGIRGSIVWNKLAPVQVKGDWDRALIDHAFSELVFLRL